MCQFLCFRLHRVIVRGHKKSAKRETFAGKHIHGLGNGLISPVFYGADDASSCYDVFANTLGRGGGGGCPRYSNEGINRHFKTGFEGGGGGISAYT